MSNLDIGELSTINIDTSNIIELVETYNSNFEKLNIAVENIGYLSMTSSISTSPTTPVEKGTVLDSITFNWSYNKRPISQSINGEVIEPSVRTKTYTEPISSTKSYVFRYSDNSKEYTKTYTVQFISNIYYGVSSLLTLDSTDISSLSKKLSSSKSVTFSVRADSGQYIYYALPSSYGKPTFKVGGFEGGFSKITTLDHTNSKGYVESYDIWRSVNQGLGDTTVVVS